MATSTFPKKRSTANAVAVSYTPQSFEVRSYLPEVVRGVSVSMKHFFENTRDMIRGTRPDPVLDRFDDGITTISYPEEKRPYPTRFRGVHRLTTRTDGSIARATRSAWTPASTPSRTIRATSSSTSATFSCPSTAKTARSRRPTAVTSPVTQRIPG